VSAELAAKLSASLPKFSRNTPVVPKPGTVKSEEPAVDQPRNGIIRLPNYDVREGRTPPFRERELLTPAGRVQLALKRHPGLKFGPFASLNIPWGLEMLAEEQKKERQAEMADLTDLMRTAESLRPVEAASASTAAGKK
jgi:hypothetical protein